MNAQSTFNKKTTHDDDDVSGGLLDLSLDWHQSLFLGVLSLQIKVSYDAYG